MSSQRGLKPAVEFWKAIFLDYDSNQLVFFDPKNMSKIHQVVEIKQGAGTRRVVRSVRARLTRRGIPSHRIKVQRGISERFAAGVRRSGRYMAHMRKIFSARGLPVELTYLPLVESSFRNDARSFRGAVGMWQFMPSTGRLYMRVTRLVDERRDPLDATRAAARLLQDNYRELGTWPLAVTAYNHGRAGMRRAVRRLGTRDIVTIIRRYRGRTFKFASKNFYAEFLAAVHIMRDLERHLPHVRFDQLVRHQEISLTKRVAVSSLLRHSRVSRAELLTWNPALSRHAAWMPAGYRLKAPELQSQRLPQGIGGHWADAVVPVPRRQPRRYAFRTCKSLPHVGACDPVDERLEECPSIAGRTAARDSGQVVGQAVSQSTTRQGGGTTTYR